MDDFDILLAEQLRDHDFKTERKPFNQSLQRPKQRSTHKRKLWLGQFSSITEGRGSGSPPLVFLSVLLDRIGKSFPLFFPFRRYHPIVQG